jgi:hypothetical protein
MPKIIFKKSLITAAGTIILDFLFHFFLTRPMETLTYFLVKFLLAFLVASFLLSRDRFVIKEVKSKILFVLTAGLVFSALMSIYYRAWELFEAYAPFGSRAPDIIGINRGNLILFSGTWWLAHALFFAAGAFIAIKLFKKE